MGVVGFIVSALVLAGVGVAAAVRSSRIRHLERLRADWGQPVHHVRKLEAIAASHRARAAGAPSLDDRTWEDLDLDAVFAALDRTESTLGQHALYHRLRTVPVGDHLEAFEALIERLGADARTREIVQIRLARLSDPHGYDLWWLARPDAIEAPAWYVLFPILSVATLALLGAAPFWPRLLPVLLPALAVSVLVRYLSDRHVGAIARAFRQIAPIVATGESLAFLRDAAVQPLTGALQSDVPRLRRLKTIARWISGDPFMLPMTAGPVATLVNDVVNVAYEYLNLIFVLDATGVYFGAADLRAHGGALVRVAAAVGEVDAALSIASVRAGRGDWTRPRFQPPGRPATLTDLRHPLIEDAVPNSCVLRPGCGVLITGSNMSGKSTFLRATGVNAVLAQTTNTCFAGVYQAPVLRVRSCIGRADDLSTGTSYYLAEVELLLSLVRASEDASSHLFLLDEVFRGTNAVERIAGGEAVLRQLLVHAGRRRPNVVVAATHDAELVDLLVDLYDPHHFTDEVGPKGLVFDHRLKAGPATTRNAIALLRVHGAPEELVARALARAAELDRQRATAVTGG